MNHPENEILLALFDGELPADEAARVEWHVESCADCRDRMAELEETATALAGVIAGLDAAEPESWRTQSSPSADVLPLRPAHERGQRHAEPATDAARLAARLQEANEDGPDVVPIRRARRSSGTAPLRWAAGILLLAGAGAAAALLTRPWAEVTAVPESVRSTQAIAAEPGEPNVFHVAPDNGALDVSLTGVAGPTRIVVAFADEGEVTIEATGPDNLHVQSPRGSVTLDLGATPATLRMTFPSGMRAATIRVDDRIIARIVDGQLNTTAQVEGVTLTAEAADRS